MNVFLQFCFFFLFFFGVDKHGTLDIRKYIREKCKWHRVEEFLSCFAERFETRNKLIGFVTQRLFLFHCLLLNIKGETTLRKKNWVVNANLISSFFMLVQLKIFKGFSFAYRNWLWFMWNNFEQMMKVNNNEIFIFVQYKREKGRNVEWWYCFVLYIVVICWECADWDHLLNV